MFFSINRQVLTDLQQKVNNLQANTNQQPVGSAPQATALNTDLKVLNELRDTVQQIKTETNTLLNKAVRIQISSQQTINSFVFSLHKPTVPVVIHHV